MIDFALNFYNNNTIIFYLLLFIIVIIEGPIIIIFLSLLAPKLGISFVVVYICCLFGEFIGDTLHYLLGRFFKKNIFKEKKFNMLEKLEKKLENHSIFDKLVAIKYTPPITSIGFIYLGYQKTNFKLFLKNIFIIDFFHSILITTIGYNLGKYLVSTNELKYIIIGFTLGILILFILLKILSHYFVKYIINGKK